MLKLKVYRKDKVNQILTVTEVQNEQEAHALRGGIFCGHKCVIIYPTKPPRNPRMNSMSQILSSRGGY